MGQKGVREEELQVAEITCGEYALVNLMQKSDQLPFEAIGLADQLIEEFCAKKGEEIVGYFELEMSTTGQKRDPLTKPQNITMEMTGNPVSTLTFSLSFVMEIWGGMEFWVDLSYQVISCCSIHKEIGLYSFFKSDKNNNQNSVEI